MPRSCERERGKEGGTEGGREGAQRSSRRRACKGDCASAAGILVKNMCNVQDGRRGRVAAAGCCPLPQR